jgi:hypothetical protein
LLFNKFNKYTINATFFNTTNAPTLNFNSYSTKNQKITKKPIVKSKTHFFFKFTYNGFLFLTDKIIFQNFKKSNNHLLKKNLFSFSFKNEMQRYILKKYLKNKFISTFSNHFSENLLNLKTNTFDSTSLSFFTESFNINSVKHYNSQIKTLLNDNFFLKN